MSDSNSPLPATGTLAEESGTEDVSSRGQSESDTSNCFAGYEWPIVTDGRYLVSSERARGGLGRVLEASDRRLDRSIAVKELLAPENQSEARFVREALVTARLQHPAIVPIYDVGRWPDGKPFYAMKMVSGRSLAEVIQERATLDERLALIPNVIAVADAIAYAHENNVVHRDLKPSNILIGRFGETLVIDWGLATDLQQAAQSEPAPSSAYQIAASGLTVHGAVLGTPEYMPPEQARGEYAGERADVYALGAILYHVLAGGPPYAGTSSSEVLKHVASEPPIPLERRQPGVPEDLATIVRKAMARNPEDRYASAKELAEDLKRFQTGQLVNARHYSRLTLFARWLRRFRLPVGIAGVFIILLGALGFLSFRRIVREHDLTEARKNELTLVQAKTSLDRDPTAAVAWLKTYPQTGSHWDQVRDIALEAKSRQVAKHVLRGKPGTRSTQLSFSPDGQLLYTAGRATGINCWNVLTGQLTMTHARRRGAEIYALAISPDGKTIASSDGDGQLELWSVGTDTTRLLHLHSRMISALTFSPGGRYLGSASWDKTAILWDLETGRQQVLQHESEVERLSFSPDGRRVATLERRGVARVWSATGESRQIGQYGSNLSAIAFSPDGTALASTGEDGLVRLWDIASGKDRIGGKHDGAANAVRFSRDGKVVASAGVDQTVRLWDTAAETSRILGRLSGRIGSIEFVPEQASLAAVVLDSSVTIWALQSPEVMTLYGYPGDVLASVFSPNGEFFASSSSDNAIRIWRLGSPQGQLLSGHGNNSVYHVAFSNDGRLLASTSNEGLVRLWDSERGTEKGLLQLGHRIFHTSFSPDGRTVLITGERGIVLWDYSAGTRRILIGHTKPVWSAAFSGDHTIASASVDGTVRLWNVDAGSEAILYQTEENYAPRLSVSADGKKIAWSTADRTVSVRNVADGATQILRGHEAKIDTISFSPNGNRLAAAALDRTIRIWELDSGDSRVLKGHAGEIRTLAFSPDNKVLASGADDNTVRLWSLTTGESRVLLGHEGPIRPVAFSPDGKFLVSGSGDKTVRLWEIATGSSRIIHRHGATVNWVVFSPDGKHVASSSRDQTIWLSTLDRDDAPRTPQELRAWMDSLTTAVIGPQNVPTTTW